MNEIAWLMAGLIAAGLFAGLIGGLFGVGGGVVIVPALYVLFGAIGVPEEVRMHVCVATSISTIIATSWRSLSTHAKAGAVDFAVLRAWTPWIAAGAALGALSAHFMNTETLIIVFGVGLLLIALQMGFGRSDWRIANDLPTGAVRAAVASAIGFLSALMGIGGGAFGVTLMTFCGRPMHQSVATASGFGAAIALPATLGFIISGWGRVSAPLGTIGYVNLPGFIVLALLTAITAPIGARLAHRLDQRVLRRCFAVFLAITALNMLRSAFT
ncbi:MAG: sulfite exporter TauE/SafE family protein [Terricaulis silvestris]